MVFADSRLPHEVIHVAPYVVAGHLVQGYG